MEFTKMHGTGNDFIVIDDRNLEYKEKEAELAKKLCDRHFGIGADGILLVRPSAEADIQMVIINSDGSYASMCGNGTRCFAKYVWDKGICKKDTISIETGDGVKIAYLVIEENVVTGVKINMGLPSFNPAKIPSTFDSEVINRKLNINNRDYVITSMLMGVPHTIVVGRLNDYDVTEGRFIEKYPAFPQGTNVNFCEVVNQEKIKIKTWERGAGPTLACGTGSCAAAIAANRLGLIKSETDVEVPGGVLHISIEGSGVYMTGPAVTVFEGKSLI